MSYYAELDNAKKTGGDVATNSGWSQFREWVEDLDIECVQLQHLAEHGWSQNLKQLESDIRGALDESPDSANADIAEGLLAILDGKADAEVLVVTDGCGVGGSN